jgi:hypothetical protein
MLSGYKSHTTRIEYTQVTVGSDGIEVGLIALRLHSKRQWISQINDAASLFLNITLNDR